MIQFAVWLAAHMFVRTYVRTYVHAYQSHLTQGIGIHTIAWHLQVLANAVRGVAAGTQDRDTQEYILQSSKQVMEQSVALIREAKNAVEAPNQPNKQLRLAQVQWGRAVRRVARLM